MTDRLLTAKQVANRLQVSVKTVHAWRKSGRGPRAIVQGKKWVRYRLEDVEAWIADRTR